MRLEYFQMLDRVKAINLDEKSIEVRSVVPKDSPIFEGHFPGYPLVPGVLLIECMAQASGILYVSLSDFKVMPFLMSVDGAKMRHFVEPDQVIDIKSTMEHDGSGFFVAKTSISVEGKRVCNGQLKFATRPFDELPTLLGHINTLAEQTGLHEAIAAYKSSAKV